MPIEGLAEGLVSGPFGFTKRATTYQALEANVAGTFDSSVDVDGDSSDEAVDHSCLGDGLAAESFTTAAVSLPPPASVSGQDSADGTARSKRIRLTTTSEVVPEKTIDGVEHPPSSYTDATGRRFMMRLAPGRASFAMERQLQ